MPTAPSPTRALTIPEACQRLGIGRSKLYDELARGNLAARKAGGRTLVLESEVERYLAALPAARFSPPPDIAPDATPRRASAACRAART